MSSKKAKPRRPSAATVQENAIAVSVSSLERLKWWLGLIAAGGAGIGVIATTWLWLGLPTPVLDRELKATLTTLKHEVQGTIDTTKNTVIVHTDTQTKELKRDISGLAESQGAMAKSQAQLQVELLEDRVGRYYALKTEKEMSLSNIESLLAQPANKMDPAQRQNLIARKAEQGAALKWVENELSSAQERLRRAKQR